MALLIHSSILETIYRIPLSIPGQPHFTNKPTVSWELYNWIEQNFQCFLLSACLSNDMHYFWFLKTVTDILRWCYNFLFCGTKPATFVAPVLQAKRTDVQTCLKKCLLLAGFIPFSVVLGEPRHSPPLSHNHLLWWKKVCSSHQVKSSWLCWAPQTLLARWCSLRLHKQPYRNHLIRKNMVLISLNKILRPDIILLSEVSGSLSLCWDVVQTLFNRLAGEMKGNEWWWTGTVDGEWRSSKVEDVRDSVCCNAHGKPSSSPVVDHTGVHVCSVCFIISVHYAWKNEWEMY